MFMQDATDEARRQKWLADNAHAFDRNGVMKDQARVRIPMDMIDSKLPVEQFFAQRSASAAGSYAMAAMAPRDTAPTRGRFCVPVRGADPLPVQDVVPAPSGRAARRAARQAAAGRGTTTDTSSADHARAATEQMLAARATGAATGTGAVDVQYNGPGFVADYDRSASIQAYDQMVADLQVAWRSPAQTAAPAPRLTDPVKPAAVAVTDVRTLSVADGEALKRQAYEEMCQDLYSAWKPK